MSIHLVSAIASAIAVVTMALLALWQPMPLVFSNLAGTMAAEDTTIRRRYDTAIWAIPKAQAEAFCQQMRAAGFTDTKTKYPARLFSGERSSPTMVYQNHTLMVLAEAGHSGFDLWMRDVNGRYEDHYIAVLVVRRICLIKQPKP